MDTSLTDLLPTPLAGAPTGDHTALGHAVAGWLDRREPRPLVVGFGEPRHLVEAFSHVRNALFERLVTEHGFRTFALESDCWAGRIVDDWVRGGPGDEDDVLARGFSHGFGAFAPNRALVRWMRAHNADRPADEHVRFAGVDAPLEILFAHSPRAHLEHLHGYLAAHLDQLEVPCTAAHLDALLGPDAPWVDEAAAWDPTHAIARHRDLGELRTLATDLALLLAGEEPVLVAATDAEAYADAATAARCAVGLLAYHHAMGGHPERRWTLMSALRDLMMADTVSALARRGPVLVFAHNQHLRTGRATLDLGPIRMLWQPLGAHLATRFGERYRVIGTVVGRVDSVGIAAPDPDTVEGMLAALPPGDHLLAADAVAALRAGRPTRVTDPSHIPPDDTLFDQLDAVAHLRDA